MKMIPWIPMNVHTAYSLGEGTTQVKDLVAEVKRMGYPAVAVTDTDSLAGGIEFCLAAAAEGIQPILGLQLTLADNNGLVTLLVQNATGYATLLALLNTSAAGNRPALLDVKADGLVMTLGGRSPFQTLIRDGEIDAARAQINALKSVWGDRLCVALERTAGVDVAVEKILLMLAREAGVAVIAGQETFYLTPDLHEAHDIYLAVSDGLQAIVADRRRVAVGSHLPAPADMAALFADLPEALDNSVALARRFAFKLGEKKPSLPAFPGAVGTTEEETLRLQAQAGLATRLNGQVSVAYADRLNFELDVIVKMGFSGYFLIVSDFIGWAKDNAIAVGPGRGSGAGSLVAWALRITDLDPIAHGLLFERFLNPERVSMPDFDIDFCQARRDEVIAYVRGVYGSERVAQIGTYGKMTARAVVRDVGRALGIAYPVVDRLSKMIPNNPSQPVDLAEAMTMEPLVNELPKADSAIQKLFDIALKLEGAYRHASTHAAGVVITDRPVAELVPVMRDADGALITQYDMKSVEKAGVVKFDFLGLKTLDIIEEAKVLSVKAGTPVDPMTFNLHDDKSFAMLGEGDSFGVFQLESGGMRRSLKDIRPNNLEDLTALISLYRPGPMDNIADYAARKHGLAEVDHLHPMLKGILGETHGVMIYQEQVMQIAQVLAGYTLGGADLLRRAMGKKIKAEMDAQRGAFVEGAVANGVNAEQAGHIFDKVEKFAGYGFNKSHAACYAVLALHTAIMKAHAPSAFAAASLNAHLSDIDRLAQFVHEARRSGLTVTAPCVNLSEARFDVRGADTVVYALSALRGFGEGAADKLIAERQANGVFTSLENLVSRTAIFMNRRGFETLIAAGALDLFGLDRAELVDRLAVALGDAKRANRMAGQMNLFGEMPDMVHVVPAMSVLDRLYGEFNAMGVYMTGHPMEHIDEAVKRRTMLLHKVKSGKTRRDSTVPVAAMLATLDIKMTKKMQPMAIISLSDTSGVFEAVAFPEDLERLRPLLATNKAYTLDLRVKERNGELQLQICDAQELELKVAA